MQIVETEHRVPCWDEDNETIKLLTVSVARGMNSAGTPLIPSKITTSDLAVIDKPTPAKLVFPLCPDHLITLLQFNVLRASIANRRLLAPLEPASPDKCSSPAALHILPRLPDPHLLPTSLHPTALQCTIPHEDWIDIIPHPGWRDNVIRAVGHFDEDELWSDVIGGLFEGFPDSDVEHRGVVAWSPPWHVSGWEVSEGFWRKWGWTLDGCEEVLEATNTWRRKRGEEPLVWEVYP
jgi:hypothetical protein